LTIKIYAVGDIMLGEQDLCENFGVKSVIRKNGVNFPFDAVSHIFNEGDIVFGNLECSIMNSNRNYKGDNLFFCAEPGVVHGLKKANFNVISVANNHIMENGKEIYLNTINTLKKNNIVPVGIKNSIKIIKIKGCRIAFLAYSFIEDNIPDVCYNKIKSEDEILTDIEKAKSDSDLIIVSLHWGFEYVPYPSPDQIEIGRELIDSGADIILGGHPHVTQSYEMYKGRPIIYSLGNFIFDHTYISKTRESFISEITISDSLDSIKVKNIPVIADKYNYKPRIVNDRRFEYLINEVEKDRNFIEGSSTSDYCESFSEYIDLYRNYKKSASREMKIHFIKNFYRYSYSTTLFVIKAFFIKKWRNKK
jgi:gamma-polyglutamate biosynthesis protein CapA